MQKSSNESWRGGSVDGSIVPRTKEKMHLGFQLGLVPGLGVQFLLEEPAKGVCEGEGE